MGDAARVTREKIRSLGSERRYATETTIFSTGSWGPVVGNEVAVEKERSTRYKINFRKAFEELEKLFSKSFSKKAVGTFFKKPP